MKGRQRTEDGGRRTVGRYPTAKVAKRDPWNAHMEGYPECRYCCANDRMEIVRKTDDMNLLFDISKWPDTQTTVRKAAESKMRRLFLKRKSEKAATPHTAELTVPIKVRLGSDNVASVKIGAKTFRRSATESPDRAIEYLAQKVAAELQADGVTLVHRAGQPTGLRLTWKEHAAPAGVVSTAKVAKGCEGDVAATLHPDVRQALLLLADVEVAEGTIRRWSAAKREEVRAWAAAVHLRASDNIVVMPSRPAFLPKGGAA